jgi:2-succinyl-5-enolpyruvyl-6-hydroxy-3-cyclohexene-1-carboxylate synthase
LRYIRTIADRAVSAARGIPSGPVHLNLPFREPLTPEPIPGQSLPLVEQRDSIAWQGRPGNAPYIEVHDAKLGKPEQMTIGSLLRMIVEAQRGLIIVGPNDDPTLIDPLVQLAAYLGFPILADPLSQLRCGEHHHNMVLSSYDAFLRIDSFIENAQPDLIIRFGAMPTSKPLLLYLKRHTSTPLVVIDGNCGWEEPTQLASQLIHANPTALCQEFLKALEQQQIAEERLAFVTREHNQDSASAFPLTAWQSASRLDESSGGQDSASAPAIPLPTPVPTFGYLPPDSQWNASQAWLSFWQDTDRRTQQALQDALYDTKEMFEGRVFSELSHLLQAGSTLYVGNSMPVRDLDTFFWSSDQNIRIVGNRGTNGIDGVISSALGASAAAGNEATVLVLGDLSFFHDLNGLLAAHLYKLNLTIILINNDGGGIFSFLPQAAHPQHFEQLFGTPTGLNFQPVVEMYGGRFQRVDNWESFRKAVNHGLSTSGLDVIEIATERTSNVALHRQLWEVAKKALAKQH